MVAQPVAGAARGTRTAAGACGGLRVALCVALHLALCVALGSTLAPVLAPGLSAQGSPTPPTLPPPAASDSVIGSVVDAAGHGIPGVALIVQEPGASDRTWTADSSGRFALAGFVHPSFTLVVRHIGYRPKSLDVTLMAKPWAPITITLDDAPVSLQEMNVVARGGEIDERLREFNRRRTTNSFGHYVILTDITKRHPSFASEMLRFMPGVQLVGAEDGTGNRINIRGCEPLVWVDGVREAGAQLDDLVSPPNIAGIEVYESFAGVPAEYFDNTATCGTILVWTRAK